MEHSHNKWTKWQLPYAIFITWICNSFFHTIFLYIYCSYNGRRSSIYNCVIIFQRTVCHLGLLCLVLWSRLQDVREWVNSIKSIQGKNICSPKTEEKEEEKNETNNIELYNAFMNEYVINNIKYEKTWGCTRFFVLFQIAWIWCSRLCFLFKSKFKKGANLFRSHVVNECLCAVFFSVRRFLTIKQDS